MNTLSPLRVLYADQNDDARFMVTTMLKFSDINVYTAETVAEAWQMGRAKYFDLYLLESRYPDGSGMDLCRRLREYAPHTPILFYSADAYEVDKQKGLAAGADAYLIKPYLDDLALTIQRIVKLSKLPAVGSYDNTLPARSSIL